MLNGSSAYNGNSTCGASTANSVTGTEKPPAGSPAQWLFPVVVWNWDRAR